MIKKFNVRSKNQGGGITAGKIENINIKHNSQEDIGLWANPIFKNIVIPILIGILILGLSIGANKMFGKDKIPSEVYNVESNNQSGGITAGRIDNVNINSNPEDFKNIIREEIIQGGTVFTSKSLHEKDSFVDRANILIQSKLNAFSL